MVALVATSLLTLTLQQIVPLAGRLVDALVTSPLLPWLLIPTGIGLGGFLLLGLLTILDG